MRRAGRRGPWYPRAVQAADGQTTPAGEGTVVVRLFAGLDARSREGRDRYEVPAAAAATVAAALAAVGLPTGLVGLLLVNGRHARPDDHLRAGDELSVFPPLGGG